MPLARGDELAAEAATAMAGAASAALVIDQRIGLRLALEAADLYAQAGHFYSAFIQGAIYRSVDKRWKAPADRIAERGLAQVELPSAASVPAQLAYLAVGLTLGGDPRLGQAVLSHVPLVGGIGPDCVPFELLHRFVNDALENAQSSHQALTDYLLSSFGQTKLAGLSQPGYKQMMPWNVGLPLDTALLVFRSIPTVEHKEREIRGPTNRHAQALLTAAYEMQSAAETVGDLVPQPLERVLAEWL